MLLKLALVLVLVLGGAAFAYRYVHRKADDLVHAVVDPGLPSRVQAHPWTPLVHERPVRSDTIRFDGVRVRTVRCHLDLGDYSLTIIHGFSFQRSDAKVKPGCPGRALRRELSRTTKVTSDTSGSQEVLTFENKKGHPVLRLQARG